MQCACRYLAVSLSFQALDIHWPICPCEPISGATPEKLIDFGWLDSIEIDHLCSYGGAPGGERDLSDTNRRQQLGRTGVGQGGDLHIAVEDCQDVMAAVQC